MGTYRLRVPASRVGYVPDAQGGLPPGSHVLYYGVRVAASGVGYVQRTVATQAAAGLPAAARVAAVGDSLHHDVLGAAANGIDSVFICGGVHYRELGVPQAAAVPPTPAKLAALLGGFAAEHEGTVPTHALAGFRL